MVYMPLAIYYRQLYAVISLGMNIADHLVKLVHTRDLAKWERLPAYEQHTGKTLAEHRAEVKAREDLESQTWGLREARRLVEGADAPKVYQTATVHSPWPISLPGRRSVRLPVPKYLETSFEPEFGGVEEELLVLPLFTRSREIEVSYLISDRVAHHGRIAQAEAELAKASEAELKRLRSYIVTPAPDPVLFISHRWMSESHPDPDGHQLEKLNALKDCYVIYDYSSFPQSKASPEARQVLAQVLNAMNSFIDNVVVLSDRDYMSRGWCLYEYIFGSLTHQITCDEVRHPALVRLRNLVASNPDPSGIGSTYREMRNGKSQLVLEAVDAVLPLFRNGRFTLPADRMIVKNLLIKKLRGTLPSKQEYVQYVGEWKSMPWTEEELVAAFESKLEWEPLQGDTNFRIFEPTVPDTIAGAVATGYTIQQQPKRFGRYGLDALDFSGLDRIGRIIKVGVAGVVLLLLLVLYYVVRWVIGI